MRIPLSAFPRYDGGQEPGSDVGIVDFAAITDVVFLLEQPDPAARGREECALRISNLRFVGKREVLCCVTDNTFP